MIDSITVHNPQFRCSVVICSKNRPKALQNCLDALQRQVCSHVELLVVGSACPSVENKSIAEQFGARYLGEPYGGLSRARNLGVRESSGEFIAFTDDDAQPSQDWLQELLRPFEDPTVALVTGRIVPIQSASEGSRISSLIDTTDPGPTPILLQSKDNGWFERAAFGGIGNGGNMALRKSVSRSWPGFDERLGRGAILDCGEDNLAFVSLIEKGWRVAYSPKALVSHPYPESVKQVRERFLQGLVRTTAFAVFLFSEFPSHRKRILAYAWRRLWNMPSSNKPNFYRNQVRVAPRWRILAARVAGVLLFLNLRLRKKLQ